MVENNGIPIVFHCPEWPESTKTQGATLRRAALKEILAGGEDIKIIGGQCGHLSSIPPVQERIFVGSSLRASSELAGCYNLRSDSGAWL
jgi:hypothetical protein